MQNGTRELPALDLLRGFEAAARNLSFTRAGLELHLTQSAVSRQVKALEEQLGVALFHRRHRELLLTEAGQTLYKAVSDALRIVRETTARIASAQAPAALTVATTVSFASLWLVPRLSNFQRAHPDVEVRLVANNALQDLERSAIDVAIRFCPRKTAGPGASRLFGERVFPVCSPKLAKKPLAGPESLANFVLLHYDDPEGRYPWTSWAAWFEVMGSPPMRAKGALRFDHYDQLIQATIEGQGVALGRTPLVEGWMKQGKLVAPFGARLRSALDDTRAYYVVVPPRAQERADVRSFVAWLRREAVRDHGERLRNQFRTKHATKGD